MFITRQQDFVGKYYLPNNKFLLVAGNFGFFPHDRKTFERFSKYISSLYIVLWTRVIFKGKGYRLRKFKGYNKVTCNFGHSHWTRFSLTTNFFFKKLRRQNYICLSKKLFETMLFQHYFKKVKPLNVYTKRGLRLKKQPIKRRFGKISQVVSSLH